jgi:hypothetical protein
MSEVESVEDSPPLARPAKKAKEHRNVEQNKVRGLMRINDGR